MAMKHYNLPPVSSSASALSLEFDWDEATGELQGPDAEYIRVLATCERLPLHPHPLEHALSAEPLKSRTDMAVIAGMDNHLTPDLAAAYPRYDGEHDEGVVY